MKKNIIFAILFFLVILCSCQRNYIDEMPPIESSASTVINPFKAGDDETMNNDIITNYGFWLNKEDYSVLTYCDNNLNIPITIQNDGTDLSLGVMIFLDGILQKYTSDNSNKESFMQIFNIKESTLLDCELNINKIDLFGESDNISLTYLIIENPQDIPNIENLYFYHSGTANFPVKLILDSEIESYNVSNYNVINVTDTHIITDDESQKFYIDRNEKKSGKTGFILAPYDINENMVGAFAASDDGKLNVKLYGYSVNDTESTYRVSIYKNHERIPFNSDCDYLDIKTQNGYISVNDLMLEDIYAGDFIYCIAVPIDTFDNYARKTDTILILNNYDMPTVSDGDGFFSAEPFSNDYDEGFFYDKDYDSYENLPVSTDWVPVEHDELKNFELDGVQTD